MANGDSPWIIFKVFTFTRDFFQDLLPCFHFAEKIASASDKEHDASRLSDGLPMSCAITEAKFRLAYF